jgi:alkanesulfonate monooxygenase SsuD/methylene tetrahydromethanopterin reductase-like flavin-dependent oxidoreductase (luciferase family)
MKFHLFVMGTKSGSYHDILDQMQAAEELGYDAVVLAERHFRHSELLSPSPFCLAAAIAARTKRIRIGLAARILTLDHPLRIAEDAATLDVLSGGRLDFGATRASLDEECHNVFRSPIDESRSRFQEALEIIVGAWTQDRFSYPGRHYCIPEVSVFPRPIQKPHPPISLVTVSPESLKFAAGRHYSAIIGATRFLPELQEAVLSYRNAYAAAGLNGSRGGLCINRFIYVSDTDEHARREIEAPFLAFIEERAPDLRRVLVRKYGSAERFSFERFREDFCIFGSPDTVATRIGQLQAGLGMTNLLCTLNFVTLEHALCLRSMELFAREVMPRQEVMAA